MAKRTPNGTNSTSFAAGAGNPFNPSETEFHAYWGVYTWDASAAPNSVGGRSGAVGTKKLPNETNNPLTAPEFEKLRVGDTAGTAESSAVAGGTAATNGDEEGLFVCIYPGTVGGGNAVWVRLDNDLLASQTIRDAHVIVVGQTGVNAPLSNAAFLFNVTPPGPNAPTDGLNLGGVGEQLSITVDYLDVGNGSELNRALLAAAAGGQAIDIRLRPCSLDLGAASAPAVPLTVPVNCRLIGASREASQILSKTAAGASQQVLFLDSGAELIDMKINSPSAGGAPGAGTGPGVVECGGGNRIFGCWFSLSAATGAARTQNYAVYDPTASAQITQCLFAGASDSTDVLASPSVAISFGDDATPNSLVVADIPWEVAECTFGPSAKNTGWNEVLRVSNVATTGRMHDCYGDNITRPVNGAINIVYSGTPDNPQLCIAPVISDVRLKVDFEQVGDNGNYYGVRFRNLIDGNTVTAPQFDHVLVAFTADGSALVARYAFRMTAQGTASKIETGTFSECIAAGHTLGIALNALTTGSIDSIRIVACITKNPQAIGAIPRGIFLDAAENCAITNCGITNCSSVNAPATGFGLSINTAQVTNTVIGFNNLTPSGGTAYSDSGTNTEAAHNILA